MKTKLLAFAFCIVTAMSMAQGSSSGPNENVWSLKQCIEYAMANNLSIRRSTYSVESSELDKKQSVYSMVPTLNAGLGYGLNWGRSLNPVTYDFTTQQLNSLNPFVSSSVTLFNGLRIQNTIKQFDRAYEAAKKDLEKTENDVRLNIALLYINVIFNKEQLNNARFLMSSGETQLDRVKKQVEAGALPRSEELNLTAQVATNEVNVINQENALNLSLLQLKQALQLPAATPLDVELMQIEVEDIQLGLSREDIFNVARTAMPEIEGARLRVESSTYAMKAAKGNMLPRVSLNASINSNYSSASDRARQIPTGSSEIIEMPIGYVQSNPSEVVVTQYEQPIFTQVNGYGYRDQLEDNLYRSVSLNLTIPIFNGMQSRYGYQRASLNREVARITAIETENTLRQNVETAYNNAVAAAKTYNSALRQVEAREEAFRMMEQRVALGAANSFEYQISQNDLFRAKTDFTRAKYDFIFRKKVLDFYQGKPIEY
ncbi:MAG TPA: TolC family protein [Chryseosolibacter sp.]|nr:TolC family protein [Chryseosolibacter sp.]